MRPAHSSTCARVAAELLAQQHGHGILQMRAADLDDVAETRRLSARATAASASMAGSSSSLHQQRGRDDGSPMGITSLLDCPRLT